MFDGKLPECLHNLTNLHILDLSNNLFIGNFPSFTTNLTSLAYMSLSGNYLQGSFSLSTLANHSKLQALYISSEIPGAQIETEKTSWFPKFQLTILNLRCCNINKDKGSIIPSFLLYQYDLRVVDLSNNKLVGEFSNWFIKDNTRLNAIYLRNNSFAGNFHLFSTSHELQYIDMSNNNISGVLQKDIGNLLPEVSNLNLSMNIFEGNIPTSIGEMKELNFLQGSISIFAYGSSIQSLYLSNNNFSGTLKEILKFNRQLSILDLSNNSISGAIPSSIGKFTSMTIFLAAENKLQGEIPFDFSNISSL
ncbi:LRR receptor-like serine/threonine-protein kinase GSO1, partial [Mucuna pruriens]